MSRTEGCKGNERHYVESSGSDLMVFLSALLDARCEVPFSERTTERKQSRISVKPYFGSAYFRYNSTKDSHDNDTQRCSSVT